MMYPISLPPPPPGGQAPMKTLLSLVLRTRTHQNHWRNKIKVITARIRRMGEGTVFSLFVSSHLDWGGGVSQQGLDGGKGVPQPGLDGGGGVPQPGFDGGWYPSQAWMVGGTCGTPWPGLDGVPPPHHKHSEHLLRGGRYASCVHAGGLSCFIRL